MNEDFLTHAYKFVFDFKYMNTQTGGYNKFDFEYKTPSVNGLNIYQWNKDLNSVKPSALEYIIYYLQDTDTKMIIDAFIAYLYYWKIRKTNTKKMREVYKEIYHHYTVKNSADVPISNILYEAMVYSISLSIGSIRVNKFGLTTDKNRYKKLVSDIKDKYSLVSIGDFTVHQELQFKTFKQAKEFEKEALKNLKLHKDYSKCKNCFDGYRESYLNVILPLYHPNVC